MATDDASQTKVDGSPNTWVGGFLVLARSFGPGWTILLALLIAMGYGAWRTAEYCGPMLKDFLADLTKHTKSIDESASATRSVVERLPPVLQTISDKHDLLHTKVNDLTERTGRIEKAVTEKKHAGNPIPTGSQPDDGT